MKRRTLLGTAAAALALSRPHVARAQGARLLRFIPQADLSTLDPHWNTAYVTRNHGFMVFDTLYGVDSAYRVSGQMVAGHTTEDNGKTWTLTLRPGMTWHDGTPVLARDCVASLRRWGTKDAFGQVLMAATDSLTAPDDRRIVFRLKYPFALLPDALAKTGVYMPAMMPERLAKTDPTVQVTEMVGSGPFRFKADERVPGARAVYERFAEYVPLASGTPSGTAGPKIVNLDRVVWNTTPDPATAAAALQANETDWWEFASADLAPLLRKNSQIKVQVGDPAGQAALLRMNWLQPPFNNPAIRRVVLKSVVQSEFLTAMMGDDRTLWRDNAGAFTPGTPMASDAGMDAITAPRDYDKLKQELKDAGYKGETVALIVPTDFPNLKALADVGADMLRKIGMNVDYQAMDWGSVLTRRAKKDPVAQGGWSVFFTFSAGTDQMTPATQLMMRGNGANAWFGWPDDPKLEELRSAWFAAPDVAAQQQVAAQLQLRVFDTVPFVPLGQYFQPTAYRTSLSDILSGFALFWNVKKSA
ncbi:ABC transporter substrate-binding protein [Acidisphaera sp. L21]|uniref:ABC transporter substrate-binding protein n=1 Tax=Acidisphaera sp. L21 TaxID=1641851 RepID=UPI00131ECC78|nr:ABC transporter substrate-binding protein [Acidisphaera sp. L21]